MKDILLTKPKARTYILFKQSEKDDDWLIDIKHLENKTKKEKKNFLIIKKDVEKWIKMYESRGWIIS